MNKNDPCIHGDYGMCDECYAAYTHAHPSFTTIERVVLGILIASMVLIAGSQAYKLGVTQGRKAGDAEVRRMEYEYQDKLVRVNRVWNLKLEAAFSTCRER